MNGGIKMIKELFSNSDILDSDAQIIAHGVAEKNIEDMATGLAYLINQKFPESFKEFKRKRMARSFKLGDVILCGNTTPTIAYLATQQDLYIAKLSAINKALRNLDKQLIKQGYSTCAIPKIGCGYGKQKWEEVKEIFQLRLSQSPVTYFVYVGFNYFREK